MVRAMINPGKPFDRIIVGGGSAGCVLAARLSEDASCDVLLIESGPDLSAAHAPAQVLSAYPGYAYFDPSLTYTTLKTRMGDTRSNQPDGRPFVPYSQGRILGGSSAINGIGANRGAPSDYDEWETMGAEGWNWHAVLPFFRGLERDMDMAGPLHGSDGPLPIRRVPQTWRSGFVNAAVAALAKDGIAEKPDQNGAWEDGVFAQKVNLDDAFRRVPSSLAWLTPQVRARPNLTIMTGVAVHRLLTEGRSVVGVSARIGSGLHEIRAREVLVCAGALQTPVLLLRSGIGPSDHLKARGITPIRHLAGVGRNLMEHPYAGVAQYLPAKARMKGADTHHIPAIWRFSSGLAGCPEGDMHMGIMGRSAWHGIGRRMGVLAFWVNKSFSRGFVELDPAIDDPPVIDMRLLSDERDRTRLRHAFRRAAGLAHAITQAGAAGPPQPARMSDRARKYGAITLRNRAVTGLAGALVDLSGPFASHTMRRLTSEGPTLAELLGDDALLDAYLDQSVTGVWHASGTCRMGHAADPLAVCDNQGRVHGVPGLRIGDASLFPTIPCANLNIPVLMTAERIATLMRE
jgi:5-(hydroxymethyl)furfural/furfural oxidase